MALDAATKKLNAWLRKYSDKVANLQEMAWSGEPMTREQRKQLRVLSDKYKALRNATIKKNPVTAIPKNKWIKVNKIKVNRNGSITLSVPGKKKR